MANSNKSLLALAMWTLIVSSAQADDKLFMDSPDVVEILDKPAALVAMAVKYEHAEGVSLDYTKAVDLYCRAARSGYADAQYALGWMYANGRGVTRDDGVAAQLFTLASNQGHIHARDMLRYIRSSTPAPLPSCLLPDKPAIDTDHDHGQTDETVYFKGPISDLVYQLAPDYKVDPKLVLAIISVESGFNVHAKSPKNAQGLMQLIPETAQRFRVKNAFDPADNIRGGLAYLQWLLAFFKGNVPLVAAAYNAGEHAVEKYRGIPPYPETKDYVRKVTKLYRSPTHPYKSNLVEAAAFVVLPVK
ncbi:MAG: transglycosylase SLT domain-containing protein [Methylophilaceae bacterium]